MSQDIKQFLIDGNQRFINKRLENHPKLTQPQSSNNLPICALVGCADSRTCAEHIFSQSLGNFYSVRNAGHYVTEEVIASLEFAINGGIKNIMIYGHTKCGAIEAALSHIQTNSPPISNALKNLLSRFEVTVRSVLKNTTLKGDELLTACIEQNIHQTKKDILEKSEFIRKKVKNNEVDILSGIYDLDSGKVRFFD